MLDFQFKHPLEGLFILTAKSLSERKKCTLLRLKINTVGKEKVTYFKKC